MNIVIALLVVFVLFILLLAFALCKVSAEADKRLKLLKQKEKFKC